MNKRDARLKRARRTRMHIRRLNVPMLSVHRTPQHIYAQVIAFDQGQVKVLVSASSNDKHHRTTIKGSKTEKAVAIGKALAARIKEAGIEKIALIFACIRSAQEAPLPLLKGRLAVMSGCQIMTADLFSLV